VLGILDNKRRPARMSAQRLLLVHVVWVCLLLEALIGLRIDAGHLFQERDDACGASLHLASDDYATCCHSWFVSLRLQMFLDLGDWTPVALI
jgi:hypothetical protein